MCFNFTYADGDREKEDAVVKKLKKMCANCDQTCREDGCESWRKAASEMLSVSRMFALLKVSKQLNSI